MLSSIFALFFRSLRGDSRAIRVHLTWMLLLFVIYVALLFAQGQSRFQAAPGLEFFRSVIYLDAAIVTMLGISFFSSAISEEKEEDTLGLMTMAGISPLGLLLGKSTTRLFQVFLLFAIQYPFTLLAITLGGLMPDQILAAYAALLSYTTLLANVGLFCSVLARRNRDASGLTMLWLIAYIFVPLFALAGYHSLSNTYHPFWSQHASTLQPMLLWVSETSILTQLYTVTETGYQFAWTPQLISNLLFAVVFFLASWKAFQYVSHDPAPESTTRSLVPQKSSRLRWFGAGRTWNGALTWKDFHFIAGGWFSLLIRCGLYIGLYVLSVAATYPWEQPIDSRQIRWEDVTYGYEIFVVPLFLVDCALCASRVFQEEIRHQTLASLLMLPRSVPSIMYSKLTGCLFGLIPGMIAVIVAFTAMPGAQQNLIHGIKEPAAWWFGANALLVIHLCLVISLYLRWGAIALAIGLTFGLMMGTGILVNFIIYRMRFGMYHDWALGMMAIPTVLAVACCHMVVLLRLPALGEK